MDTLSPPFVEPIVLTEDVVTLARGWAQLWLERQPHFKGPQKELVAQGSFRFPHDGPEHFVAIYMGTPPHRARAFTALPNQSNANGNPLGPPDHFVLAFDPQASFSPRELLASLLHELTHVVDPEFLADARMRRGWVQAARFNSELLYRLRSERKAFASMWIAEIRECVAWEDVDGVRLDPSAFVKQRVSVLREFGAFVRHAGDLQRELEQQIQAIARSVRQGS